MREAADLQFMGDVAGTEHACGEPDKSVQHNEDDVEIINLKIWPGRRSDKQQHHSRRKREQACDNVQPG